MKACDYIKKTREYLDYLERHLINVDEAWHIVKEKCADMRFIYDDVFYHHLEHDILQHDLSKLSKSEFIPYRETFYPTKYEPKNIELGEAWAHHQNHNPHHWQHWTNILGHRFHPDDWEINAAHMVIDWMAMGTEFGDTAKEYYEKNRDEIKLPKYAIDFIYEIFKRVY